ncbi:hypothetical protein [Yoonia sp. R78084]|uniref:hypothetical protein n=1 Tax=Yoonia sp. R78084 TaxID=3093869 RepID=UPI0037DD829B
MGLADRSDFEHLSDMEQWHRIYDDETAQFGNVTWKFEFPEGDYGLTVNQSDQNFVNVNYQEATEHWPIQLKEQKGSEYKLSGMAWATPEIGLAETCWFELLISSNPQITFWGDRVIIRTDQCCQPQKN